MLSLSTSWNAIKHSDGIKLVREIKDLGFENIEVNYQVTGQQLADILELHKQGEIKVSSLHNLVPLPQGADPNTAHRLYPFTSPNSEVRKKAVTLAKQTIDHAVHLGAGAIVLHLGESWEAPLVEVEKSYVNAKLKSHQSKERIEEIRQKLIQSRKACSEEGVGRIIECLRQLVPYAEAKGVKLGFENRYWHTQFPTSEELGILLQEFKSDRVGMWFDVGHAATQEYFGFQRKNELLEKYANRMIGVHLMDCIRNSDHLAPGKGQYDFANLSKYLKPSTIKVLELALYVTPEDLKSGVACLHKQGIS
jgi:sugar phosphate isomerase/epimerase